MNTTKKQQAKKEMNKKDKEWREACLERDNYQCVMCKKKRYVNVHHILSRRLYSQFRHEVWNGICLCAGHHKFTHRSPHQDAVGFVSWLIVNNKQLLDYLLIKQKEAL